MIRDWVAGDDEDVHSFVERQLVARIGDAGRRLHTGTLAQRAGLGRSRGSICGGAFRVLQAKLRALVAALADQAERAGWRSCRPTRTCAAPCPCWSRTFCSVTPPRCAAITIGWPSRATKPMRCRSAPARSPGPATPSTSQALAARLGFQPRRRATAWTPRPIATSPPSFLARLRARDGASEPARRKTSSCSRARSSGSSSWPIGRPPAAA